MSHRRKLLKLASRMPVHRGRQLVALVCAMALGDFVQRAAAAWESDMTPVRDAIVTALQSDHPDALTQLREACPKLLVTVNHRGNLVDVLGRQLLKEFTRTVRDLRAHGPLRSSASLEHWRSRSIFPTDLPSADLQGLSAELRLRSIFSARTTNADYLQSVADVVDQLLGGKINLATARWELMKKLKLLGYDPETGFPQDMASVPPAEKETLRDLSSEQRLNLMLKTNVALARNYARVVDGNTDFARYAFPAWKLVRLERREVPRGERIGKDGVHEPDPENAWPARWQAAGESVGWEGASMSAMIALKDSPIWQALADGVGGYHDTLGHPFPPFAFNSGMDWEAVPRAEVVELQLISGGKSSAPMEATLTPAKNEVQEAMDRLGPDFRESLFKELEDLAA